MVFLLLVSNKNKTHDSISHSYMHVYLSLDFCKIMKFLVLGMVEQKNLRGFNMNTISNSERILHIFIFEKEKSLDVL